MYHDVCCTVLQLHVESLAPQVSPRRIPLLFVLERAQGYEMGEGVPGKYPTAFSPHYHPTGRMNMQRHFEVRLLPDGSRNLKYGRTVSGTARSFDDAFVKAEQNNPGLYVRKISEVREFDEDGRRVK